MKSWNFNVKRSPIETGDKLESALGSVNGFVFNMNYDTNNSITFKVRRRILYGWYMVFHNWTIVNGKLSKTDIENETNVKISFSQHFLMTLLIVTNLFMGLCFLVMIILGIGRSSFMYIVGGMVLGAGIVLWIAIKKKFEKDTEKYKTLISEIIEH